PGPQQEREIARRLHGKAARDDATAAGDRLADHRGADYLVVEHDGERLADILARRIAEPLRSGRVEGEADDRLVVLKFHAGVGQRIAADHDPLVYDIGAGAAVIGAAVLGGQDLVAGRHPTAPRIFNRDVGVDKLKGQLGGTPEQGLDV